MQDLWSIQSWLFRLKFNMKQSDCVQWFMFFNRLLIKKKSYFVCKELFVMLSYQRSYCVLLTAKKMDFYFLLLYLSTFQSLYFIILLE